jgi:hypothetical protein
LPTKKNGDVAAQLIRKENTNHINGFFIEKPYLHMESVSGGNKGSCANYANSDEGRSI